MEKGIGQAEDFGDKEAEFYVGARRAENIVPVVETGEAGAFDGVVAFKIGGKTLRIERRILGLQPGGTGNDGLIVTHGGDFGEILPELLAGRADIEGLAEGERSPTIFTFAELGGEGAPEGERVQVKGGAGELIVKLAPVIGETGDELVESGYANPADHGKRGTHPEAAPELAPQPDAEFVIGYPRRLGGTHGRGDKQSRGRLSRSGVELIYGEIPVCLPLVLGNPVGMQIDFTKLSPGDAYHWMIAVITPRPIAWVSTISPDGVTNLAPFSFFQGVCANPPTLMFSGANDRSGRKKDTILNIEQVPEFVVNVVPYTLRDSMNQCAAPLPYGESEFARFNIEMVASQQVRPPRVAAAPVALECRLDRIILVGEGPLAANVVFGRIVAAHVSETVLDDGGKIDPQKLDTIGRMGGDFYSRTTELFTIARPR